MGCLGEGRGMAGGAGPGSGGEDPDVTHDTMP